MEEKHEGPSGATEAPPEAVAAPKQRLKKPVKPDVEEHKAAVEQLQNEMQKRRTKMEQIKQQIDHKRESGGSPEMQQARTKLNELSSKFKAELDKKKSLRAELQNVNKDRENMRSKLRDLKTKVGAQVTVEKLEERIAGLEYRITHHTLDLKEENKTREEMKKLAALKPTVAQYNKEQTSLDASDGARDKIKEQLSACDDRLNGIKAEEEKQRALVNDLRSKDSLRSQDVPALLRERDECREVMNALWQKIQEMREEHRARHNQFWEDQQAWQRQSQEDRRLRQQAWEAEKAEKEAARKKEAAEFAGEPYHKEVGLCEQLINHLSKYRQQEAQEFTTTSSPAAPVNTASAFEGMKAVKKKGDADDEFGAFYGSGGPKKAKGKKGKPASSGSSTQGDQKLNHSLDMIEAFSVLKVSVPTTSSKVPDALKEVEESKAHWLKKRAEAKETGVVPTEEPEASSSSKSSRANGVVKAKENGLVDFSAEEWPDFAGNVSKTGSSAARGTTGSSLVTVKLGVQGEKVSLTCEPAP